MNSYMTDLATEMVNLIGKNGQVKFDSGMADHYNGDHDTFYDTFLIGEPNVPIEKEHILIFLKKLDEYITHKKFQGKRTYAFEGIGKNEDGSLCMCWAT